MKDELEYYLGYTPGDGTVAEAEEWRERYPNGDISEWVDEMVKIGAL